MQMPNPVRAFIAPRTEEPTGLSISEMALSRAIRQTVRHKAVKDAVDLFEKPVAQFRKEEDQGVDLWIVLIPDEIYKYGRPKSSIPSSERISSNLDITRGTAIKFLTNQPSMFEEDNEKLRFSYLNRISITR